ncbi:MAG TPA: sensor domain-containing diguanylate cyclase [Gammaproteobacteria bacterium]|nr:sensor domain-containing diguanylate cyclase [Gammaproteobacteria bacterium]
MLSTYRARLIFYTSLLTLFLLATLAYTYVYSRNAILEQAENNITNTARLLTGNIEMEENELLHYAEVIRDDPRIQEYMFMVTKVGAEQNALRRLFERNFGWLPIERFVFVDLNGQAQLDTQNADLANAVQEHLKYSENEIFYTQGSQGLELVAWAPIAYQGTPLGTVAVTHILNSGWLSQHQNYSGGHLFIEKNNVVQLSTLPQSEGKTFLPRDNTLVIDDDIYQVRAIPLSGEGMSSPHLWHGLSEQEMLNQLTRHSQLILALAILGGLAVLTMGLMIARNFNRPLSQLMHITKAVTQGALPTMGRAAETNEINTLANRFSEMLQSLREKQEEIDRVHKRLEESAITDSLTGLHNRRYLKQIFPKLFAQAQRELHCLSGLMLDLDYFKRINDRHGHLAGDLCLAHMGQILKESCRASDYVFRMGGEEFLILSMSDSTLGGELLAEKIRSALRKNPVTYKQTRICMTTSIGVSVADNNLDAEAALTNLLFQADKALYAAKNKGRNRVIIYNHSLYSTSTTQDAMS